MKQRYGYQHLGSSLGNAIGALMQGDAYEKAGRLDARQQLGQIMANEARAAKAKAEEEQIRQRMQGAQQGRQDFLSGQTGLAIPQLDQLGQYVKSGNWGSTELMGPPDPGQRSMPSVPNDAPQWYTPDVATNYNRARSTLGLNAVATKDSNAEQLGKALAALAKTGDVGAMINGQIDPTAAAAAYGAVAGKPVYSQGTQGVLQQYTGDVAQTPKLGAEIAALNALAGQRDAAANAYNAKAAQPGGGKPPAVVATLQYLQDKMSMSQEQALAWVQTAKFNPTKAALDLATKRYQADAAASAGSFGEIPMPDFNAYLQEAQGVIQGVLQQGSSDATIPGVASTPEDPAGLLP